MSINSSNTIKALENGLYAYRGGSYTSFEEAVTFGGHYLVSALQLLTKPLFNAVKATCHAIGDDFLEFVVVDSGEAIKVEEYFNQEIINSCATSVNYSLDGGLNTQAFSEGMRVYFSEAGEDADELLDLHINITQEGLILDVVGQSSGIIVKTSAFDIESLVELCS